MKRLVLSWLLHHANRQTKDAEFYAIKDRILSTHGTHVGYDIQKLPGKLCRSCGGTGQHARYSNTYPYKAYDWDTCWHCVCGWYHLPKWVCLSRIEFGRYTFHKPLKKEEATRNPFTAEELGWQVSDRPVIKCYIEHTPTWFGQYALLILSFLYDRVAFRKFMRMFLDDVRYRIRHRRHQLKRLFTWPGVTMYKPLPYVAHYIDPLGQAYELHDDLPF